METALALIRVSKSMKNDVAVVNKRLTARVEMLEEQAEDSWKEMIGDAELFYYASRRMLEEVCGLERSIVRVRTPALELRLD